MNNNTLYTRCPTCSTAFKVTDSLLSMAKGKVRCGACLAIFQATDYMLEPKNHPTDNSSDQAPVQQALSQPPSSDADKQASEAELSPNNESSPNTEPSPKNEHKPEQQKSSLAENDNLSSEEPQKFEVLPDFNPDSLASEESKSQLDEVEEKSDIAEPEWSLPEPEKPESHHEQLDFESIATVADDQKSNDVSDMNAEQEAETEEVEKELTEKEPEAAKSDEIGLEEDPLASLDLVNEASEEDWGNTRDEHSSDSQLLPEPSMMLDEAEQISQIASDSDSDRNEPQISDQCLDHAVINETDESSIDTADERTEGSAQQQPEQEMSSVDATDIDDPSIDSLLDDALLDLDDSESIVTSDDNSNESRLETDPIIDETIVTEDTQDSIEPESNELGDDDSSGGDFSADEFEADEFETADIESERFDADDADSFDVDSYDELDESQFDADDFSDELSTQLTDQMAETDASPDPLDEFDEIVNESNSGIKGKLIGLSLLILLVIGFQQIWSNRQTLAWSSTWGSSIKAVCGFLPCDLKARRDVSKIRLLQRQVAPDENQEDMLDVKVLLVNEADFDQPYPTIKITFTNTNSETVAVKTFPANSYLSSDALDELMPSRTEVHIHFKSEAQADGFGFEFSFE